MAPRRKNTNGDADLTFVISVAAELAGMHAQTLRQYDRLGLVTPARTKGGGRRYTRRDVQRLRDVQRMSQEDGINLAGIQKILELERKVEALEEERAILHSRLEEVESRRNRVFAATTTGEVRPIQRGQRPSSSAGGEVAVWQPWRPSSMPRPTRKVRAVIEAGPSGVRVIEGTVRAVE
ncbi:heat shock protein transcriptional repressor HspR [Schaalia vaccimaxillae]|uniref:heat shock protein transcriptional repressor HspR n=1 Tax=Schaalia vaccimaxillae TaxID=183916 RepID=UPI0003B50E6B|nr:helix-turn-helix transcriptional regulator [Schaalia vaccimaxillae]